MVGPDECSFRQLWRNEGATLRCSYTIRNSRRLPIADRQERNIPGGRLFICLQRYPRATYSQLMEGHDFNLPPDD